MVTYVLYALEHPAEFRLMFRPEMAMPFEERDLHHAPVYRELLQVIHGMRAQGIGEGDPTHAAITAWSGVHRLAALLIDGPLHTQTTIARALAVLVTSKLPVI